MKKEVRDRISTTWPFERILKIFFETSQELLEWHREQIRLVTERNSFLIYTRGRGLFKDGLSLRIHVGLTRKNACRSAVFTPASGSSLNPPTHAGPTSFPIYGNGPRRQLFFFFFMDPKAPPDGRQIFQLFSRLVGPTAKLRSLEEPLRPTTTGGALPLCDCSSHCYRFSRRVSSDRAREFADSHSPCVVQYGTACMTEYMCMLSTII